MSQPTFGRFSYDRAEVTADGAVHALGLVFGVIGVAALVAVALGRVEPIAFLSVVIYGLCLLAVLSISAVYNLWPVSPIKWRLRQYDHAAIYLLIAGTYTPFVVHLGGGAMLLLGFMWTTALAGAAAKILYPGRFDRLSVVLYLAMGWSGVFLYERVTELPPATLQLLALGGLLYTAGVAFHLWESLRFQNAIWHGFVLVAAACHYGAVLDCVIPRA